MHYLWKATHRGATNFYSNLSSEERKILKAGGWDKGSYNDFVNCGGCVSKSDALHDPATYVVGAVAGAGVFKAASTLLGIFINSGIGGAPEPPTLPAVKENLRFNVDQDALIQLAKDAKQVGGVTVDEAQTLLNWADEYGLPGRGPEIHPDRLFDIWHIHIGPVNHIPVFPVWP